jgi:hypothetical protein
VRKYKFRVRVDARPQPKIAALGFEGAGLEALIQPSNRHQHLSILYDIYCLMLLKAVNRRKTFRCAIAPSLSPYP